MGRGHRHLIEAGYLTGQMDCVRAHAARRDPLLNLKGVDCALHVEGDDVLPVGAE